MRLAITALLLLAVSPAAAQMKHDPYRWCAHYKGEGGAGTNCYFMTLEQCRWAISGAGGYCGPNPFYGGATTSRPRPRRN